VKLNRFSVTMINRHNKQQIQFITLGVKPKMFLTEKIYKNNEGELIFKI